MNFITKYVGPGKLFLQNVGLYPVLYDQYIQLGKEIGSSSKYLDDKNITGTEFEYQFQFMMNDLAELTLVKFQGIITILITLGGLYKSFSLIATILFSYWTTRAFEQKMVKDLQKSNPKVYGS